MNKSYTPYSPVDARVSFPKQEEQILDLWARIRAFERQIEQRTGEEFVFYDGPPFATGLPHFGHFVPGTIKDVIPRYHAMCGKRVTRRFGWDCHGLPVEYEVEKALGISGKSEIEKFGITKFNQECRSIVLRYTKEWEHVITRMGRWVDFSNDYKTMDPNYMESIWWVFQQLWERDLVYRGYYILPYSPGLATPLSNFEVNLGGYQMVDDPALTVRFEIVPDEHSKTLALPTAGARPCALLAWTTTPWTLPSNLGLAVGADIDYVLVEDSAGLWIIAAERVAAYWGSTDEHTIRKHYTGRELQGLQYRPLFPYFADSAGDGAFVVRTGDFVTTEEGTGIVHTAPAFGEDDYNLFRGSNLKIEMPLDAECRFTAMIPDYEGLFVKDADKKIIADLKAAGAVIRHESYRHSYPFCWRTKQPLIYRAVESWFVKVEQLKEDMLAANQEIFWVPEHMQAGRFGHWLEQARDWAISRNRYWGNPIPIWQSESGKHIECIGSIAELEQKSGVRVTDLHKHIVDEITWEAPDGDGLMRRVPEVLDCWFESGSMPYAQNHYPFENRKHFEDNYPADFICEGLDQTRGWFYTLTVLSAALFKKPPAYHIVVNGLVLDSKGQKMSKSQRNYSDPKEIIDTYGADALRLFLLRSPVVRGDDFRYSDDGVREVLRKIIIPLWNAYSFYVIYANIDKIRPRSTHANITTAAPAAEGAAVGSIDTVRGTYGELNNPFDQWLCSESERLVATVRSHLDLYDLQRSSDSIVEFIDNLNNWYIRRCRRRFWSSVQGAEKEDAYHTLRYALLTVILVAAPLIPFVTEAIYQNIRDDDMPDSIHLCDYPLENSALRNLRLEEDMRSCLRAVQLGRSLRKNHKIRNRQPISRFYLISRDAAQRAVLSEFSDVIAEELNAKEVLLDSNEEEYVTYSAKPNYQLLGKELGRDMKEAAELIGKLESHEIRELLDGATLRLELKTRTLDINSESVLVHGSAHGNLAVDTDGSITAIIDPEITPELRTEGIMRDVVRFVQRTRKDIGLEITDKITLHITGSAEISKIIETYRQIICEETLAVELTTISPADGDGFQACDFTVNDEPCTAYIAVAADA